MEKQIEKILEIAEFDGREESGGNWRGHMGRSNYDEGRLVLASAYCDPFWGANMERLEVYQDQNVTRVLLIPETENRKCIDAIYKIEFSVLISKIAALGTEIQNGPTFIFDNVLEGVLIGKKKRTSTTL